MKGITSNFDLIKLAKLYDIPLTAVIYKNHLIKFDPNEENSYIIDLHDDTDQSTGHWVALTKRGDKYYYFDSFGIIYPNIVKEFCKNFSIVYNKEQIQSMNSQWCGQYCILFLYFMKKGYSMKDIQNQFNQFD